MNQGFVVSDKTRHTVFSAVANGETDVATIAKRHRMIARAVERAARELGEAGLIVQGASGWRVTPAGEEIVRDLKKTGMLGGLVG